MCAIAGLMMRSGRPVPTEALGKLRIALHHRGPDASGVHVQDGVALIDLRLAIVDVEGGKQPLYGPAGSTLVAVGEIYNAPELRDELGGTFRTLSDCEPPAHIYDRVGAPFAEALRGMYTIAIHDPARRRLLLARDPFGIKPLYYTQTDDYLAFASEPQALFAAGLATPVLDVGREAELLQLKYTTGQDTVFAGVRRVAPGETLVIEDARIVERLRIATLPPVDGPRRRGRGSLDDALHRFEAVMTDSVSVHLRTDVPYGLFFSGGIDSSILLTLMQRLSQTPVQALTAGYPGDEPGDESRTALELAKTIGAQCRRVEMSAQDFWTLAPRIAAAIDDPTADPAVLPTYVLGREARAQGLKVTLCGEGADELFGGYSRYRRARWRLPRLGRAVRRGVFEQTPEVRARCQGWSAQIDAEAARQKLRFGSSMRALQALDCVERLPNGLLIKLDRCLMANSVEGRTPFLDKAVAAFALELPDALRVNARYGKVLLREWLARAFPQARPFAPKQGFNPPVGRWMAGRAAVLAELTAAQPGVAAWASPEVVRGVFANAAQAHQPAWSLLYFALWHSHHVLGVGCDGDIAEVLAQARSA